MKKKGTLLSFAIIAYCMIMVGLAVVDKATNDSPFEYTHTNQVNSQTDDIDLLYEHIVGDIVTCGDAQIQVSNIYSSPGVGFDLPTVEHEYIIIDVSIKNNSHSIMEYSILDFKLLNNSGKLIDNVISVVNTDTSLDSGKILPGGVASGSIVFEHPINDELNNLVYISDLSKKEYASISLTNARPAIVPLEANPYFDELASTDTYAIDVPIYIGPMLLTVTDVSSIPTYSETMNASENLLVQLTIKNTGTSPLLYEDFKFGILDNNGQITHSPLIIGNSTSRLEGFGLQSGEVMKGSLTFEQPLDELPYKLIYTYAQGEYIVIDLTN